MIVSGDVVQRFEGDEDNRVEDDKERAQRRVYLDHAASAPLLSRARAAMLEVYDRQANPSSPHQAGRSARAVLEKARNDIKQKLGWKHKLLFTSGASEAAAIAIGRAKVGALWVGASEHDIIQRLARSHANMLDKGLSRTLGASAFLTLPIASNGKINIDFLETQLAGLSSLPISALPKDIRGVNTPEARDKALLHKQGFSQNDTLGKAIYTGQNTGQLYGPLLIAVQHVNSETGVIQDIEKIYEIARAHGAFLLCDCAQSAGKIPLPDADMIILSAHKFGGPQGVGALLIKDLGILHPVGGQEQGYRSGTEAVPLAAGMAAALEENLGWMDRVRGLRMGMDERILALHGNIIASDTLRISTISSYHMAGVPAKVQLILFDDKGIAISAGSACSSGSLRTSPVLDAMGMGREEADQVIRVSMGPETTGGDIDYFIRSWTDIFTAVTRRV